MADRLLTSAEVAEVLRVPTSTVLKMIRRFALPAINIGAGKQPRYRVRQSALDDFLKNGEKRPPWAR